MRDMAGHFERHERVRLYDALTSDDDPPCPRCKAPMDRTEIRPRDDVSYVRRRVWLMCASCDRSIISEAPKVVQPKWVNR